ncbi:hypothetical protein BI335_05840 [Enemella evansiae]|nr:hypothetical protein BI335_05840 [Enemella evansiae]
MSGTLLDGGQAEPGEGGRGEVAGEDQVAGAAAGGPGGQRFQRGGVGESDGDPLAVHQCPRFTAVHPVAGLRGDPAVVQVIDQIDEPGHPAVTGAGEPVVVGQGAQAAGLEGQRVPAARHRRDPAGEQDLTPGHRVPHPAAVLDVQFQIVQRQQQSDQIGDLALGPQPEREPHAGAYPLEPIEWVMSHHRRVLCEAGERDAILGWTAAPKGRGTRSGTLTYIIAQPCVDLKDRACVEECPVDCIYEGARMLYIQPDECVDCGACEPVCPVEAIYYEDDVPSEWANYYDVNVQFFDKYGSPGGASKMGVVDDDHQFVKDLPPQEHDE